MVRLQLNQFELVSE